MRPNLPQNPKPAEPVKSISKGSSSAENSPNDSSSKIPPPQPTAAPVPEIQVASATSEADKMAASLTDQQLAIEVRDSFAAFRPKYEAWRVFAIELHRRFEARKPDRSRPAILGCRTWEEFCDKVLGYSPRHVRRLLQDSNPAAKYRDTTASRNDTSRFARSAVDGRVDPKADWSNARIISTGIRLIASFLKPFERDPQRFHLLAVGIAKGLAADFLQDDESAQFAP